MAGESQEVPSSGTPDPSVLTTEQLLREIETLKEWVKVLNTGQESITSERFRSVENLLGLIERQRVEQKKDTKDAVDAALAAAKEAVQEQTKASGEAIGKSEALTTTQLAQQSTTFATGIKGVTDSLQELKDRVGESLQDLKDRIVRIETRATASTESKSDARLNVGAVVGIVGLIVAVAALVVAVIVAAP